MASRRLIAGAVAGVVGAAAIGAGAMLLPGPSVAEGFVPIDPADQDLARGAEVYAAQCASCHGADLEGAENWRQPDADGRYPAPPHDRTGHTWHHDDATLYDYVALGGAGVLAKSGVEYDSGMPAYEDILTEDEIRDVLAFIKDSWPERERRAQAERTAAASN